jgi:hypothetical protein
MAKSRSTFGKIQREQEKRGRAKEKAERKELRRTEEAEEKPVVEVDESKVLMELAKIHEDLQEGRMSLEDFEVRQDELRELLMSI